MKYRSPIDRRLRWNRRTLWTLIVLSGFLLATILDPLAQGWLPDRADVEHYHNLERKDWVQWLRAVGSLLTWAALAVALICHDASTGRPRRFDRGARLFGAALAGGAAAEILKLILRRERPGADEALYSFKPLTELLSSSNVGLPSSHSAVAMGGAAACAILLPWSAPVVLLAAVGCGMTRVLVGAHHVSDVYLGLIVGVLCARWVCALGRPRSPLDHLP